MTLEQRITKLEQASTAETTFFAWTVVGETPEKANARQFPDGVDERGPMIVFGWVHAPQDDDGQPP